MEPQITRLIEGLKILRSYDVEVECCPTHDGLLVGHYDTLTDMMVGEDFLMMEELGWREENDSWFFPF